MSHEFTSALDVCAPPTSTTLHVATSPPADPPLPPAELLADADENDNLFTHALSYARRQPCGVLGGAQGLRHKGEARRLTARWGGVWSAIAISL